MPYMVEHNGQVLGPYSLAELNQSAVANTISLSDLGCDQGTGHWVPVSQLLSIGRAAVSMVPTNQAASTSQKSSAPRINSGMFAGMGGFLVTLAYFLWRVFRIMSALARLHHSH